MRSGQPQPRRRRQRRRPHSKPESRDTDVRAEASEDRLADTGHVEKVLRCGEGPVTIAVVDDPLRQYGPHAGKDLECGGVRLIHCHNAVVGSGPTRHGVTDAGHPDLGSIDHFGGEVDSGKGGVGASTASCLDGIDRPRSLDEPNHPRILNGTRDMHDDNVRFSGFDRLDDRNDGLDRRGVHARRRPPPCAERHRHTDRDQRGRLDTFQTEAFPTTRRYNYRAATRWSSPRVG